MDEAFRLVEISGGDFLGNRKPLLILPSDVVSEMGLLSSLLASSPAGMQAT